MSHSRYGLANITIKEFLLCNYFVSDPNSLKTLRDRDWLSELKSLEDYCMVPMSIKDEIPIISKFVERQNSMKR